MSNMVFLANMALLIEYVAYMALLVEYVAYMALLVEYLAYMALFRMGPGATRDEDRSKNVLVPSEVGQNHQ